MPNTLLSIEHFSKTYTERMLFDDTDFSLMEGEKVAVIGINGTGKSTLLKIAAGLEEPDTGNAVRRRNLEIRYLPQNPEFNPESGLLEAILQENEGHPHISEMETEAKKLLNRLGIDNLTQKTKTLSGGQKKRAALVSCLLSTADLLILDEPTNHLDGEMSEWLEDYLKAFRGTLLMVTHDRYFLDQVCDRIAEVDGGKIYSYKANYEGYLELKAERLDILKAQEATRQNILRKELQWIRRGARARTTKQKGRIQRYEKLSSLHGPEEEQELVLSSVSARLGRTTIEIENLSKAYRENEPLIWDFTYFFLRNDRIGIIGPNGAGKTTLMKLIAGWEKPDSGTITVGQTVRIGYFSQENEKLKEDERVIDSVRSIAEYLRTSDGLISAGAMLERFLFPPSQQFMPVSKLSGGEKRRLYLLRILMSNPNVLLLDEPTNDLDIRTMTILEDYLDHFSGIVVAVSHDRYFLDRVVNRIFAFEGNGLISQYEGGFTDYQVEVLRRHPEEPEHPVRDSANTKDTRAEKVADRPRELKFTYKEQQDWENIESEIDGLERRLKEIEKETSENSSDYEKLTELAAEQEKLNLSLSEKMDRWEYLSDLMERIQDSHGHSKVL
jgi:ATP-binding cassette subfamily F protein uup